MTLEVDELEQNVMVAVRHMRSHGYKLRQIVASLKDLGIVGRTGKPIGLTRVFEMIHGARTKPRQRGLSKIAAGQAKINPSKIRKNKLLKL